MISDVTEQGSKRKRDEEDGNALKGDPKEVPLFEGHREIREREEKRKIA